MCFEGFDLLVVDEATARSAGGRSGAIAVAGGS
jgi:hypothetical protein